MATKKAPKKPETSAEGETYEISGEPKEHDEITAEAIKQRLAELQADAASVNPAEKVRGLLSQVPREKTASERGTDPMEYALKVISGQSPDIDDMLKVARARRALKNQGYKLEVIESVISKIEEAYRD